VILRHNVTVEPVLQLELRWSPHFDSVLNSLSSMELPLEYIFLECYILPRNWPNRFFSFLILNLFQNLVAKVRMLSWFLNQRIWCKIKLIWLFFELFNLFFLGLIFLPKLGELINEGWVKLRLVEDVLSRRVQRSHDFCCRCVSLVLK
jgi:hypothetical protein